MFPILIDIDWKAILLGEEKWEFLIETALRSFVMFLVILFSLRVLGKRGIKQLSVFELGVIIGLGSAAGDPMFYKDVGMLAGLMVFVVVIALYKLVTYLINHNERSEKFVEGEPIYIIKEGKFIMENMEKEPIAEEELLMQLRLHNVSHLGQIEYALLETNGELSLLFYEDEKVKYGLPIFPHQCEVVLDECREDAQYSCSKCGETKHIGLGERYLCTGCKNKKWVKAINTKRVS